MNPNDRLIIDRYLDELRLRNLSTGTVRTRWYTLSRVAHQLPCPLLYATTTELTTWQQRRVKTVKPSTRRNELVTLHDFYEWTMRQRLRADDPTAEVPMPRLHPGEPRPMPDADMAKALRESPDAHMTAIIGLAGFAGLRACEIAALDWADINLGIDPVIRVLHGKGDKPRTVPVCEPLRVILSLLPERLGPVIPRQRGYGYSTANGITKRASRYLHSIDAAGTLHALRHRWATAAHDGTKDLRAVQVILGHASLSTTMIYVKAKDQSLQVAVDAAGVLDAAA